jgi:hypothetical protein
MEAALAFSHRWSVWEERYLAVELILAAATPPFQSLQKSQP